MLKVSVIRSIALSLIMLLMSASAHAEVFQSEKEARAAFWEIWSEEGGTIYCGCQYGKGKLIDFKGCDYQGSFSKRSERAEIEHIVPAHQFGQHLSCWRDNPCRTNKGKKMSGRNCCKKIDPMFRKMHNDLHNLMPIVDEVNRHRSNYKFTSFSQEKKKKLGRFKGCDLYIDKELRKVEPKDDIKGAVARAYLYMEDTYPFKLSRSQRKLFQAWDTLFPPGQWEVDWNQKVKEQQGTTNKYIVKHPVKNSTSNLIDYGFYGLYQGYRAKAVSSTGLVLLFHDKGGLTENEMKRADRLDESGYDIFAVNLYWQGIRPKATSSIAQEAFFGKMD